MSPSTGPVGRLVRGDVAWPRVLLGALAVTTVVALVALAATSATAFGLYNPAWDGSSEFRSMVSDESDAELVVARETNVYAESNPTETVAFVAAPTEPYTDAEATRLRTFVERGGTLVVLENFGDGGNDLLERVGAETRVDGRVIRDEREYAQGPAMPIATEVNGEAVPVSVEQLTLNYATAVEPGADATVLVRTSPYAYLGDESGDPAAAELDSYPVAAVEPVGEGSVVVVGDPSVTINAMVDEPDNAAFLSGLYADAGTVIVDISHGESVPPLQAAVLSIRDSAVLGLAVGLVGVAAIAGTSNRRPRRWVMERLPSRRTNRATEVDPVARNASRAAALREAHPEWDEARIERVLTALNNDQRKGERDE